MVHGAEVFLQLELSTLKSETIILGIIKHLHEAMISFNTGSLALWPVEKVVSYDSSSRES